jgi:hypothetical protein
VIKEIVKPKHRDILLNLSELLPIKEEEETTFINILSQIIELNFNAKRNIFFLLLKNIA